MGKLLLSTLFALSAIAITAAASPDATPSRQAPSAIALPGR